MNTAEHMILAKPDVWCSNGSPGGGTYGVSSSNDFARAMSASLVGSGSCDAAVPTARAMTTGTSNSLITTTSRGGSPSFQEARCNVYTTCPSVVSAKKTGASDSIPPNLDVISPPGAHRPGG